MYGHSTVTQKGQITLTKNLRDALQISTYDTVTLELAKDHIKVKKTVDILDLAGTIKPRKNKNKSVLQAREAMEKQYKRF